MVNYNTDLKSWGSAGSEYPDGYSYTENEPPVDEWDNFLIDNIVKDIQSLVSTTNDRIESDSGSSAPTSPEAAHLFGDTSSGSLKWWDTTTSSWSRALDATGDTMAGSLTLSAGGVLGGSLSTDTGTTIFDYSNDHIPAASVEQSGLDADSVDGSDLADIQNWVNTSADVPNADHADDANTLRGNAPGDLGTTVSYDGSSVSDPATGINVTGRASVIGDGDGTVTLDVKDYVSVSGKVEGPDQNNHYAGSIPQFSDKSTGLNNTSEGDIFYDQSTDSVILNDGT